MTLQTLDRDSLRQLVPAAFSTSPSPQTSDRYRFISTAPVIEGMEAAGFHAVSAYQGKARKLDGFNYAKHMIRFRAGDAPKMIGDVFPELVMRNSHDGTSTYILDAGLFRLVCLNGMVIGDLSFGSIRVRHTGKVVADMIEASKKVIAGANAAAEKVQRWSSVQLTAERIMSFATDAAKLRLGEEEAKRVVLEDVTLIRREEDNSSDLWHVFNRVQENLTRRSIRLRATDEKRIGNTQPLRAIQRDVGFNKALWDMAESYAA